MKTFLEIQRIKQVVTEVEGEEPVIVRSPDDAAKFISKYIADEDREVLFVACLNTKNRIVAVHRCHVGALSSSVAHPREIFKTAIVNNSASIIVAHNHPSTDPQASREDLDVTRRLKEAGNILGIELLDHLIIGDEKKYISLKEKGYV